MKYEFDLDKLDLSFAGKFFKKKEAQKALYEIYIELPERLKKMQEEVDALLLDDFKGEGCMELMGKNLKVKIVKGDFKFEAPEKDKVEKGFLQETTSVRLNLKTVRQYVDATGKIPDGIIKINKEDNVEVTRHDAKMVPD